MTDTTISIHQEILVKGTRDKEKKEKTKKQTQQLSCSSHLKQRDGGHENKGQKHKSKKNKLQDKTNPLSLLPHPVINQPTPPIPSLHHL